jgi:hypothetical protein
MVRDNIVILVLGTGEHIIAEKTEVKDDGTIVVDRPVSIMPDPNPQNQGRLLFIPYLQFTELFTCEFPPNTVRHVLGNVKEDLRNSYAKQFGDGLDIPSQQILLS